MFRITNHRGPEDTGSWGARGALTILALYTTLAVVHTWPLVLHLDTALPGHGLGDNVTFVWNLWWMRQALASGDTFFFSPAILAPHGGSLLLHTHTALAASAGAILLPSHSAVAAQNLLLLASLVLNGIAACVLARVVGATRWPAVAAGALFLVAPAITGRLMGHFNLILAWPLAFACAALIWWWRRRTRGAAVILGLCTGVLPYADYYYAVYFGLFAAAYSAGQLVTPTLTVERRGRSTTGRVLLGCAAVSFVVAGWIAWSTDSALSLLGVSISLRSPTNALTAGWLLAGAAALTRWRIRSSGAYPKVALPMARQAVISLAVVLLALAPLMPPAWELWRSGDYVSQGSSLRSSPRGVDPVTLLLGPPHSGIAGQAVAATYRRAGIDVMESSAWMGLGTTLLIALAWRRRLSCGKLRSWFAVALGFFGWSLGPYLTVLGANTGLLLPQALAHVIPILNNARIPGRAMTMVALAASVLIALVLTQSRERSRHLLGLVPVEWLLVVVAVAESLAAPLPLAALPPRGVYERIAAANERGVVLPIPFGIRDGFGERGHLEHDAIYGQTIHGRPMAGGFLARMAPHITAWYDAHEPFRTLLALSSGRAADVPSCAAILDGLRSAAIVHVVFYGGGASPQLRQFVEQMPLQEIARDGTRTAFRVDADGCGAR